MDTSTLVEIILKSAIVEKVVIWDLEINLFNLKVLVIHIIRKILKILVKY